MKCALLYSKTYHAQQDKRNTRSLNVFVSSLTSTRTLADNQRTTSHKCFVYLMNYARCRHLTIIHYKGGKLRNDDTAA